MHILCLAETHLKGGDTIKVDGYTWYGHNRQNIHVRAKCGSGGVGVLVRNDFVNLYDIQIIESDVDGIMWIRFCHKYCNENNFHVCIAYLPPENSTRSVNAQEFFDNILSNIYTIPQGELFSYVVIGTADVQIY